MIKPCKLQLCGIMEQESAQLMCSCETAMSWATMLQLPLDDQTMHAAATWDCGEGSAVAPCDGDVFRDDASCMNNSDRRHLGL
jgi:hypothetical protein